jgi:hypothetical protein
MSWFDQLKLALPAYYPPGGLPNVAGYLRGSKDPSIWRSMQATNRNQMIILGSKPPSLEDWSAAGVGQRGNTQTITFSDLSGFIVIYGGFIRRPWGKIYVMDAQLLQSFPTQIDSWKRNYMPPKP